MAFALWVSARKAREVGCTHRARFLGLVPGFIDIDRCLWVSRSDLLAPVEDVLMFIWATTRRMRGEEPDFIFAVGSPI